MGLMGLEAIHPKPRLSRGSKEHQIYPSLLRDRVIDRPDSVWCADITYIRMSRGFIYLVAIMDWFSRYVLSWEISLSLEKDFCLRPLDRALGNAQPEILTTDQGSQFTCSEFTSRLRQCGVSISMDGRGRVFDNIFIERLWRRVKYEEVYLHDYQTVREARETLAQYFEFYNTERFHSSLGDRTPYEIYCEGHSVYQPYEDSGLSSPYSAPTFV